MTGILNAAERTITRTRGRMETQKFGSFSSGSCAEVAAALMAAPSVRKPSPLSTDFLSMTLRRMTVAMIQTTVSYTHLTLPTKRIV